MRKYELPGFLKSVVSQAKYERWLHRKAVAHVRRDRKRGNRSATIEKYKLAMHEAVKDSNGVDAYTGETLDWFLISKYDDADAERGGRQHKKRFALLPTVDHMGDGLGRPDFAICAWRTNDAKNDLEYEEFLELCKKVVAAASRRLVNNDQEYQQARARTLARLASGFHLGGGRMPSREELHDREGLR